MKKETSLGFVLFVGSYLLCLLDAMLFGYSTYGELAHADTISDCLRLIACAMIIAKLLFDRFYPLRTLITMVLTGGLLLVMFLLSGYSHVFYLLIVLLGIRNIDPDAIIKLDFYARLLVCVFIIISSFFIVENYITVRTNSAVLRSSLGFNHPNTLAAMVMSIVFEDAVINERKFSLPYLIAVWLLAAVVFLITANRTSIALMIVFPVLLFIIRGREEKQRQGVFIRGLLPLMYPVCAAFSYFAVKNCTSSRLVAELDKFFSYRFYNCRRLLERYGVPLLGQKVDLVSVKLARQTKSSIALLDISYMRLLIQTGPLILIMLSVMYAKAFIHAFRENKMTVILIMILYLLFGTVESGFNNVFMNFTLIIAAAGIYRSRPHDAERND